MKEYSLDYTAFSKLRQTTERGRPHKAESHGRRANRLVVLIRAIFDANMSPKPARSKQLRLGIIVNRAESFTLRPPGHVPTVEQRRPSDHYETAASNATSVTRPSANDERSNAARPAVAARIHLKRLRRELFSHRLFGLIAFARRVSNGSLAGLTSPIRDDAVPLQSQFLQHEQALRKARSYTPNSCRPEHRIDDSATKRSARDTSR